MGRHGEKCLAVQRAIERKGRGNKFWHGLSVTSLQTRSLRGQIHVHVCNGDGDQDHVRAGVGGQVYGCVQSGFGQARSNIRASRTFSHILNRSIF